jgi:putative SOS response-associated peptidase YedK
MMQWGLVPHWARDPRGPTRPIHARAETLAERPIFRGLLKDRRCLVPESGVFEWRRVGGGPKAPFSVRLRDAGPCAFAGLYDVWRDAGAAHPNYALVTTATEKAMTPIGAMEAYPVSVRVNSPATDDPSLIAPLEEA